jgi:hypothetical protein
MPKYPITAVPVVAFHETLHGQTGKNVIGKAMTDVPTVPNWSLASQPVQVEVSRGGELA